MVSEKCWQCEGHGTRIFFKGTEREVELKCPCCRGNGLKNGKSKELVKISSEV